MMIILETSWEVCNKQGGIYTVLSSRARAMMAAHEGQVVFIGPLREELPADFSPATPPLLAPWVEQLQASFPLPTRVGSWRVPGEPPVVLVDFRPLWAERAAIFFDMWRAYGLESDKGYGDYDECALFAVAASRVMHSLLDVWRPRRGQALAIYNEWQTAMGLLYSKHLRPELPTLFITHATTVGRSIAGNGKELYAHLPRYYGDQMAAELGVVAKHAVEKRAAHVSDLFGTVSQLTADECAQLLERRPVVLPNGFEGDFVPKGRKYSLARSAARRRLAAVANALTGLPASDRDVYITLGGRYEYRNKGIDLFVESLAHLRQCYAGPRRVFAFLLVPAWVAAPRADLRYLLDHPQGPAEGLSEEQRGPLQHPTLTHWLHNQEGDAAQRHFRHLGLHEVHPLVDIIQVPTYLDGQDGILGMSYYELLVGMDLSVYPSYYEPWGYTPLESIAFGVPTLTTRYAGFGLWAEEELAREGARAEAPVYPPVTILPRTDHNAEEISRAIAESIERMTRLSASDKQQLRKACQQLAERADWAHFYTYYLEAYKALRRKKQ